ncbi:hypothetical protein Hdeb2414_s0020g00563161 [Helianthus debilis subsp. tardiflorus]
MCTMLQGNGKKKMCTALIRKGTLKKKNLVWVDARVEETWVKYEGFLVEKYGKNVKNIQNLTKTCGHELRARIKEKCTG